MNEVKRVNPIRVAAEKLLKNKLAVVCFVVLVVEINLSRALGSSMELK